MKKHIILFISIMAILLPTNVFASEGSFVDIDGIKGEEAILELVDKGIVKGITETEFKPDKSLTRAEILTMLKRLELLDEKYGLRESGSPKSFIDVKDKSWYKDAVDWASGGKIVSGVGNDKFLPNRELNREELGVIVYDYLDHSKIEPAYIEPWQVFADEDSISSWASSKVNTMCTNSIMVCNGRNFGPKNIVTREEAAIVLHNILKSW